MSDYATIQQINSEFSRMNANAADSHSTDGSSFCDRLNQLGSEDEMSTGSGGGIGGGGQMSPRMRRAIKQINNNQTASYSSTRNHSPRSLTIETTTKLRAGVATSRSSNRNSANLSTNLQEELLRLINPDTMESTSTSTSTSIGSGGSEQRLTKDCVKAHSKENLTSCLSIHKIQPDINLR